MYKCKTFPTHVCMLVSICACVCLFMCSVQMYVNVCAVVLCIPLLYVSLLGLQVHGSVHNTILKYLHCTIHVH